MSCPTTSYVIAMFHPTIGHLCSSISQHKFHPRVGHDFHKKKGNNRLTHIQIHTKVHPSQSTIGFIRMLRKWKGSIVDPVDYSSLKITLIKHGTMVINLWFKGHNIAWCAVRHNISWFERSSLTVKTWHLAICAPSRGNIKWFVTCSRS